MADLKNIIAYICKAYPAPDDLSRARLTKLVYLADWKSAIDRDRTMTDIHWYFDNFGPFVWDVWQIATSDTDTFEIDSHKTPFGTPKHVVKLRKSATVREPDEGDRRIIDFVTDATKGLAWQQFIRLVYSTYPVLSSERYSSLNLVAKAQEYKRHRESNTAVS